jgi:hypothetical protein
MVKNFGTWKIKEKLWQFLEFLQECFEIFFWNKNIYEWYAQFIVLSLLF